MRLGDDLYDICAVQDLRYKQRLATPEIVKINLPLTVALPMIAEYRKLNPTVDFRLYVLHPPQENEA